MTEQIESVIIGGGQAGLATSYFLKQQGREHIVLEQAAQAGNAWRNGRWDSFTLVSPNWTFRLPGGEYDGPSPDGFMPRDEIVARFERYATDHRLPVQYGVRAESLESTPDGRHYRIRAGGAAWVARNVVIATGVYQRPKLPRFAAALTPELTQIHSNAYRNPAALPPGAVLVVGSAQSGCQIAEELQQSGRRVFLSVGSAGRVPRRYRGKDIFEWLRLIGFFDQTADTLPSPAARFAGNPHLSGRGGGHTLNLHQLARDGVHLLGRLTDGRGARLRLAGDLKANLAKADAFEAEMLGKIDAFIDRSGSSAPAESVPAQRDGYAVAEAGALDVRASGIHSIVWAIGYAFDFRFVKLPALESNGYPIQKSGVTEFPGLYFVGMSWLDQRKSGLLMGVGESAASTAAAIEDRMG